jgi:hypothetical protein
MRTPVFRPGEERWLSASKNRKLLGPNMRDFKGRGNQHVDSSCVIWPSGKMLQQVKWGFLDQVTFATQINDHSSNDNMHLPHTGDDSRSISWPVLFHTMAMTKSRITSSPFFIPLLTNKKPRCCSVLFILNNEENAVFVFYLFTTLSLVMTHVCAPVMSANTKRMLYLQIGSGQ